MPEALRRWFVLHFVVDLLFAIPLMLAPEWSLGLIGWAPVDPVAVRLVAAALFAIGIESYLGRNAGPEAYSDMLNLKIIWSAGAVLALALGLLAGRQPAWALALLLSIFLAFNLV